MPQATSIIELVELCKLQQYHWFSPDTMRFFGTRIESELLHKKYFMTSEQPPYGGRKYSIREVKYNGIKVEIDTVGEFCVMSRGQAQRKLKELTS